METKETMDPTEHLNKIERYYHTEVDTDKWTCIDDRKCLAARKAIKLVGGAYGVLDTYKIVTGATEAEAQTAYEESGLPFGAHTGSHHGIIEIKDCGYGDKVEQSPQLVGAPERVKVEDRFNWVKSFHDAFTPNYEGSHGPTAGVINWVANTTLDQTAAYDAKLGTFNLDAWYLDEISDKLHVDKTAFSGAMISLFRKTVAALAPGTPILERK